jgi:hypothetical protein
MQFLGARHWRAQGKAVQPVLAKAEHHNALRVLSTPVVLERIRAACDGRVVLMKGYETALLYEDPVLRPFADIDLLVEDAPAVHRSLLAAGFVEIGDPEIFIDIHHLRPVTLPEIFLPVEVHHEPKWPDDLEPPATHELVASAVESATRVSGIETLPPAEQALILAAHSWAHLPLRRIQELLDIALTAERVHPVEIEKLARAWGLEGVWETTSRCIESLFYGGSRSSAERIWARHLASARERTVFESHVERWLSPYWALPTRRAVSAMAETARAELVPAEGENWKAKLSRAGKALRNASWAKTAHERELGEHAHRRRRRS